MGHGRAASGAPGGPAGRRGRRTAPSRISAPEVGHERGTWRGNMTGRSQVPSMILPVASTRERDRRWAAQSISAALPEHPPGPGERDGSGAAAPGGRLGERGGRPPPGPARTIPQARVPAGRRAPPQGRAREHGRRGMRLSGRLGMWRSCESSEAPSAQATADVLAARPPPPGSMCRRGRGKRGLALFSRAPRSARRPASESPCSYTVSDSDSPSHLARTASESRCQRRPVSESRLGCQRLGLSQRLGPARSWTVLGIIGSTSDQ